MGSAVALGLINSGVKVLMLDRISSVQNASTANFGLLWSQSKGHGNRSYARLSEKAVLAASNFIERIELKSSIDTELRLGCGIILCLGETEYLRRSEFVRSMHQQAHEYGEEYSSRMIDREELQHLVGKTPLGDDVTGGSLSPIDGDVNPLLLLRAMRKVFIDKGGVFLHGCSVHAVKRFESSWRLETTSGRIEVPRVVLAAGLGNIKLLSLLGIDAPIIPQKGQVLVTERMKPFLSFPCSGIRQTGNGSMMIGTTNENTGLEVSTTVSASKSMAQKALRIFPCLEKVRLIRSWAGLRVMTRDGAPIYEEIEENVYLLATHSCVTLASIHELLLPGWIMGELMPEEIRHFSLRRFHV